MAYFWSEQSLNKDIPKYNVRGCIRAQPGMVRLCYILLDTACNAVAAEDKGAMLLGEATNQSLGVLT